MSNGRSYSSQNHAHWGHTMYEIAFELSYLKALKIHLFPLLDTTESLATFC